MFWEKKLPYLIREKRERMKCSKSGMVFKANNICEYDQIFIKHSYLAFLKYDFFFLNLTR